MIVVTVTIVGMAVGVTTGFPKKELAGEMLGTLVEFELMTGDLVGIRLELVGTCVGSIVGKLVGEAVGKAVRGLVGELVTATDGTKVACTLGGTLAITEGFALGV
jgi:hypothetical protein